MRVVLPLPEAGAERMKPVVMGDGVGWRAEGGAAPRAQARPPSIFAAKMGKKKREREGAACGATGAAAGPQPVGERAGRWVAGRRCVRESGAFVRRGMPRGRVAGGCAHAGAGRAWRGARRGCRGARGLCAGRGRVVPARGGGVAARDWGKVWGLAWPRGRRPAAAGAGPRGGAGLRVHGVRRWRRECHGRGGRCHGGVAPWAIASQSSAWRISVVRPMQMMAGGFESGGGEVAGQGGEGGFEDLLARRCGGGDDGHGFRRAGVRRRAWQRRSGGRACGPSR